VAHNDTHNKSKKLPEAFSLASSSHWYARQPHEQNAHETVRRRFRRACGNLRLDPMLEGSLWALTSAKEIYLEESSLIFSNAFFLEFVSFLSKGVLSF